MSYISKDSDCNSPILKRKYDDILDRKYLKKIKFNNIIKSQSYPSEFEFIDCAQKKDFEPHAEITTKQIQSTITKDPLLLPGSRVKNVLNNFEKCCQGKIIYARKGYENCVSNDSFNKSPERSPILITHKKYQNGHCQHLANIRAAIAKKEIVPLRKQNSVKIDCYNKIKNKNLTIFQTQALKQKSLPFKFEIEEEDVGNSNNLVKVNSSNDFVIKNSSHIQSKHLGESLIFPLEMDPQPSFCPKIYKIYMKNQESLESGCLLEDKLPVIENSTNINLQETTNHSKQSNYFNWCHICSIQFTSETDWLSHIQSSEHHNLSYKQDLSIPSFMEEEASSKNGKENSKKNSELLHLGNKTRTLNPVPYIPLNLLKQRLVICGSLELAQNYSESKPNVCQCKTSNKTKKPVSHRQSEPKNKVNKLDKDAELPIILIPHQVRVVSATSSKPKVVLMYLPYFDETASKSFIKKSWSLPPDKWIGEALDPVKENLNVVFNTKNKIPHPEVFVDHVLDPVNNSEHTSLNLNSHVPETDFLLSDNADHCLIESNPSSILQKEFSSDTDTASETEESVMVKLGLQSVASMNRRNKVQVISLPKSEHIANKESIIMKAWATKENGIKFSATETTQNEPEINFVKAESDESIKENISETPKNTLLQKHTGTHVPLKAINVTIKKRTPQKLSLESFISNDRPNNIDMKTVLYCSPKKEKFESQVLNISVKEEDIEINHLELDEKLDVLNEIKREISEERMDECCTNTQEVVDGFSNRDVLSNIISCNQQKQETGEPAVNKLPNSNKRMNITTTTSCNITISDNEAKKCDSDDKKNERLMWKKTDNKILDNSDIYEYEREIKNTDSNYLIVPEPEDIFIENSCENEMSNYIRLLNEDFEHINYKCSPRNQKNQINSPHSIKEIVIGGQLTSPSATLDMAHLSSHKNLNYSPLSEKLPLQKDSMLPEKRNNLIFPNILRKRNKKRKRKMY